MLPNVSTPTITIRGKPDKALSVAQSLANALTIQLTKDPREPDVIRTPIPPKNTNTKFCNSVGALGGICPHDNCNFAHTLQELTPPKCDRGCDCKFVKVIRDDANKPHLHNTNDGFCKFFHPPMEDKIEYLNRTLDYPKYIPISHTEGNIRVGPSTNPYETLPTYLTETYHSTLGKCNSCAENAYFTHGHSANAVVRWEYENVLAGTGTVEFCNSCAKSNRFYYETPANSTTTPVGEILFKDMVNSEFNISSLSNIQDTILRFADPCIITDIPESLYSNLWEYIKTFQLCSPTINGNKTRLWNDLEDFIIMNIPNVSKAGVDSNILTVVEDNLIEFVILTTYNKYSQI